MREVVGFCYLIAFCAILIPHACGEIVLYGDGRRANCSEKGALSEGSMAGDFWDESTARLENTGAHHRGRAAHSAGAATSDRRVEAGARRQVVSPWTPLVAERVGDKVRVIRCWGREYRFSRSALPDQIVSSGMPLLKRAVSLVTARGGEWSDLEIELIEDEQIRMRSKYNGVEVSAEIEFDGLVRFDCVVPPGEYGYIEIPINVERAQLMHWPGPWFDDATCAGTVPKDGWRAQNTWYLWVGDEKCGLCWFAEDQAKWPLNENSPGIELVRGDGCVIVRVHLAHEGIRYKGKRTFTWGLMATPVKPMPADWRKWRFGAIGGPVTVGVLWPEYSTSKWHSFPVPKDPSAYSAVYTRAHRDGKKGLPYTNFNMQSTNAERWRPKGKEWGAEAGEGRSSDVLKMGTTNARCCAMSSSWCDFITSMYDAFVRQYEIDGFYVDNCIPSFCRNQRHPRSHHGRVHIFAARDLLKRIYTATKQEDPDNVLVCHMSQRLCIPLLSFCDAVVDGEQYSFVLKDRFDGHYMALTPPDRARAEFLGVQWGLVPIFLPALRNTKLQTANLTREMLAVFLPHGTRFWIGRACDYSTFVRALDIIDSFGLDNAIFIAYWEVDALRALAEEREILVSAYSKPKKRKALLVVSNYRERAQEVSVNLKELNIPGGVLNVSDSLDEAEFVVRDGAVNLTVGKFNFRILEMNW